MTIYQATSLLGDNLFEGPIGVIYKFLPAGSRILSMGERKAHKVPNDCDAYKTMDARIILIKIKPNKINGI